MQEEERAASTSYIHQSSHEKHKLIPSRRIPCLQKPFLTLRSCLAGLRVSLRKPTGWRRVVVGAGTCTVLALLLNIALLIWACTKDKSDSDTFILYNGDCNKTKSITTWSHLGINIISTLILSGSNYATQILSAPTRDNADVAHCSGRSVTIGAPSFSNFKYIDNRRKFLYICLVITSIPFHTIYNSVIFDTTSAIDFGMFLVTNDFFDAPPTYNHSAGSPGGLDWVWKDASTWMNLTEEDCFSAFSATYVHDYQNVVLVTNVSSALYHESWLDNTTKSNQVGPNHQDFWVCPNSGRESTLCADGWGIYYLPNITSHELQELFYSEPDIFPGVKIALVQYCLAKPVQPSCTVELSPQLLVVSIICNLVKIVALLILLFTIFDPLVTIGDAIASSLNDPDPVTKSWGVVSGDYEYQYKQRWRNKRHRYFSGVRSSQWLWTVLLCLAYLIFGIAMMHAIADNSDINPWRYGLGSILPTMVMKWNYGFVGTVLLANLPQVVLSISYLAYNSLLTRLLLSREWTNYAHHRKSLRVTKPEGQQRSTYFLSLPYTFSVPLLISSALLHWALSQSFYLVQVNYKYNNGQPDGEDSILDAGFSIIGLLIAVPIGAAMITALIFLGFRRYQAGIPLVRSDSRAISAACHSARPSRTPESLQKLQYGVIDVLGQDRYLVGLSSGPVDPLEDGKLYDYRPCSTIHNILEPVRS